MKPIVKMYPSLPMPDNYFVQLGDILRRISPNHLVEQIKSFINDFKDEQSAQAAVKTATHTIANTNTEQQSLLIYAYRISFLMRIGDFKEINTLLRSIPFQQYKDEKNLLLFMVQIAITCGLFDVIKKIKSYFDDNPLFDEVDNAFFVLCKKRIDWIALEKVFLVTKQWLYQQGINIVNVGFFYSQIDDLIFALDIYIDETSPKLLSEIGIKLDNFLINFEDKYQIDIDDIIIEVCSVSELV